MRRFTHALTERIISSLALSRADGKFKINICGEGVFGVYHACLSAPFLHPFSARIPYKHSHWCGQREAFEFCVGLPARRAFVFKCEWKDRQGKLSTLWRVSKWWLWNKSCYALSGKTVSYEKRKLVYNITTFFERIIRIILCYEWKNELNLEPYLWVFRIIITTHIYIAKP